MTAPKNDLDGTSLNDLSPEQKRALLAELLRRRAAQEESKAAGLSRFPMSVGQQGLWYAYCRDPHATPFNVFLPARIRSNLDLRALRQSVEFLASRHSCLRTTFTDEDGKLQQVVHADLPPEFRLVDVRSMHDSIEQVRSSVAEDSQRPFNLRSGPLLRLSVFQIAEDDFIVLAATHHIVVDFWSLILMLAELREVYPRFAAGLKPSLATVANNYDQFVADQKEMLEGPSSRRLQDYWRKQLHDAPTTLELVTDFERPQAFTGRAGIQPLDLDSELAAQVFQLASSLRTTPFIVVHAAIQVLLYRYTGQREFLIGSPFSGRSHQRFENTVGFFVNMLPLRADLRGEPSFEDVIQRTHSALLGALEFEAYPFSAIVRDINPPRDASRSPLFQVSCTFEKAQLRSESGRAGFLFPGEKEVAQIGDLQQESFYVPQQTCHYDLEFIFEHAQRDLRGMVCYCRDLFSADSMQRLAENFRVQLAQLLREPTRTVLKYDTIARVVLTQAPNPATSRTHESTDFDTVAASLESTAKQNQDRYALRSGGHRVTYGELLESMQACRSWLREQLVHHQQEARPLVPVIGPSSLESMMAIASVLASGLAVVPIDSDQPAVSLNDLLEDTRAKFVLRVPQDSNDYRIAKPNSVLEPFPCSAEDLAYVIYTSGSTGRPKGVMVEQRAICNTLHWRHRELALNTNDRVLMTLSHQFDAGLGIALAALTQGAELVWVDHDARNDVQALVDQIIRDQITVLPAIPSMLRLIVEHPRFSECTHLRMLWTGGEVMPRELPRLVRLRTKAELWNLYGPTETAVEAIATRIESHDERCSVPLGYPIDGAEIYIVDDSEQILPDTVPGEIAIAGKGLARGYLNRSDLTQQRFVHLQVGQESIRAYLSGDRGRRLANGQIEFLGRLDYQVKIRGYRIELEEVEQYLASHPAVAQAAVAVNGADSPAAQLVGYIRLRESCDDPSLMANQIRHDLGTRLPAYKVPVQLFVLESLPLTSSGKVDRKQLPQLVVKQSERATIQPATPLEHYLAQAWCESLKIPSVSVDQNFFELGGSSLQAAILTSKLTSDLGIHVPSSLLFDLADISHLAQRLVHLYEVQIAERFGMSSVTAYTARGDSSTLSSARSQIGNYHPLIAPLKPTGERRPIFMIHPPGGIVMCYRELATRVDLSQPLYAIRSRGVHGEERLPESIEEAAADYIVAMRTVQPEGPYRLGGWSLGGLFALEMASQLVEQGEIVEQLALLDTALPDGASQIVPSEELISAGSEYGMNLSLHELNELHPEEQLPLLWEHAKSLGVLHDETPPEVVAQVLQDLKSLFHHHMRLATRYQVRPYAGNITLVRPTEVPFEQHTSPDRGWRFVAQQVHVHYVSGHHHSMVQMPHVIELAAALDPR